MSVWYTEHYWQVTVFAMLSLCHCPSLPFSATKNCKSQARHAVFSKGTSHLLCLLISGSSCWKSRRQNTIFQHRNHANSMSTATVFSFPFFLSPNVSPSLLWKRQIEFNMRLDSHELVQTEVFMNSMQASATTRDWGHYRKCVCLFTLANAALRLKLLSP